MPTGAGKSRCFHLPALTSNGLTVVVAPLLSLILDQVDSLARRNVHALYLASTQTPDEAKQVYDELHRSPPNAKLLCMRARAQSSPPLAAAAAATDLALVAATTAKAGGALPPFHRSAHRRAVCGWCAGAQS